jgi:hypothetical protein
VFKLDFRHFIVVPGNHDIQWAKQVGNEYDPTKQVTASSDDAEVNFRAFIQDIFAYETNTALSTGRRFLTRTYLPFDIIGLNSSRLETRNFAGHGFVTRDSFRDAAGKMDWLATPRGAKRRFVVMHHHLLPAVPREEIGLVGDDFSVTLDAGELLYTALEMETDIVIHGHMHQPVTASYGRSVPGREFPPSRLVTVHGSGSVGLKRDRVGPIGKNSYTIIEIDGDRVRLRVRAYGEFAAGFDDYQIVVLEPNTSGGGLRICDYEMRDDG